MTPETYNNRFASVLQYMLALTNNKRLDYAGTEDVFKNFQLIEVVTGGRISTAGGIVVRLTDKLQRVANLLARPNAVADERIEDTLIDNAIYSLILLIWLTRDRAELTFPGQVAPEPAPVTVEPPPEGASPNTAEDAYAILVAKYEQGGITALTPTERKYFEMLLKMKLGVVETQGQEAVAA